jgi:hypothetical protein
MLARFGFRRHLVAGEWGPPVRFIRFHKAWEALLSSKFGNVVQSARSSYLYASLLCPFPVSVMHLFLGQLCVVLYFSSFFFFFLVIFLYYNYIKI